MRFFCGLPVALLVHAASLQEGGTAKMASGVIVADVQEITHSRLDRIETAENRLRVDMQACRDLPGVSIYLPQPDNLFRWEATLAGPVGSAYERAF